uniref:OMP1839 n=1 Tax=Helicobacter bizzozeronii TaxID=56877 RepID=A0A1M4NHF0_HELBI|nr:OMP1839 [Helicobacter bizzozeronii]
MAFLLQSMRPPKQDAKSLVRRFYQPRRKAPSFSYGDIRLAPAWLC